MNFSDDVTRTCFYDNVTLLLYLSTSFVFVSTSVDEDDILPSYSISQSKKILDLIQRAISTSLSHILTTAFRSFRSRNVNDFTGTSLGQLLHRNSEGKEILPISQEPRPRLHFVRCMVPREKLSRNIYSINSRTQRKIRNQRGLH